MDRDSVDAFLAMRDKVLEPGQPLNLSTDSFCDKRFKREICRERVGERIGLRIWMVTSFATAQLPDYIITIETPRPIWKVIVSPTAIYRGPVIINEGPATLGIIEGARYYSWADNRALYPDGNQQWSPRVARPLPNNLLTHERIVRWLCRQTNIAEPGWPIPTPRGLS